MRGGSPLKAIAALLGLQLAAIALAPAPLAAQRQGERALFPARPTGYVNDVAGVIDPASEAEMTSLIQRLRGATGAEVAVVTLPTLGNYEEEQVALAILRDWGVGARAEIGDSTRNAGVVVLLVPRSEGRQGSGAIRIETGYGLEGVVTDATAGRIRDLMLPQLQRGEYGPGLLTGVQALSSVIARGFGVTDSALTAYREPATRGGRTRGTSFAPILLILLLVMLSSFGRRGRRGRGVYWGGMGGPWIGGGGWGGGGGFGGGGFGGGGFGGFGGGGGGGGGGAGGRF